MKKTIRKAPLLLMNNAFEESVEVFEKFVEATKNFSPIDEIFDYTLTVKIGHDKFNRPLLSCESWPPTNAEAGVVRQMRDMLSAWLENNEN